ncbi:MAG: ComF family protein [Planctomycetota bacterium]|nr:MAG: ComF family protein [Planctomycetota bacterium]
MAMRAALLDFFLPSTCPACRAVPGPNICGSCLAELSPILHPCPHCGSPRWGEEESCPRCHDAGLPNLRGVSCLAIYGGTMERLIGDAKAGARAPAVAALARCLAQASEPPGPIDLVVPVPPNPGRRDGPHLASHCAKALAKVHGLPFAAALVTRRPAAQQHLLEARSRQRAVEDLFALRREIPPGCRVWLIDDILTSGATLSAAARCLRQGGARRVYARCLARTPRGDDPRPTAEDSETLSGAAD